MLLLGLTGSIATGKSSVSGLLRAPPYNLPIIDADVLAREVVEPGTPAYDQIVAHFGPTTPDLLLPASASSSDVSSNTTSRRGRPLDRPALGRRVFGASPSRQRDRAVLNGIVHPAVRRAMYRRLARAYLSGARAVVLDVPLLFESGWDRLCGCVLVVAVSDPAMQMRRLRARDPHLAEGEARDRVRSQADVREKARRAEARGTGWGAVVWNDGDKEDLRREVGRVMGVVERSSPWWWTWMCLLCPPVGGLAATWSFLWAWKMRKDWLKEQETKKAKL